MIDVPIFLQPRASRARLIAWHGGELKVAVTAPPVDGAANEQLLALLAKSLGITKSKIVLLSGATSRHKVVRIDADAQQISQRLPPLAATDRST